ncbi:TolC family protein [Novosphingobium sp. NDB2Meth1]|uniref:TolC family protein n=1 Tax=Novosphingobium sp. NDB2Meth1 TaxID=1892847 RepID=UPI00093060B6|nr:TolC family protein [Novosphingobium sp. NDB2Meth1]
MHRVIAALLAVASCAAIAHAQTSPSPPSSSPPFTLERALIAAGASSPSLEVADAGVRAAGAARTVAGLRPNPQVQVQVENVGGSGLYRGTQSAETTTGLALPIELGGKRSARIAVADSRRDRARIEAAIVEADLRERVTMAYVAAVSAERRVAVARQLAEFANRGFSAASTRVTAGGASPIEQQRADVERVNANVAFDRAVREAVVAKENLARLIGEPIAGELDVAWFDRVGTYGPAVPVSAQGTLIIAAAEADVTTADALVRLARSQRVPDVTLNAGARRLSASGDTAAIFGLSIPFPLFNNGRAAVSQAESERLQVDARRRVTLLETEQTIASVQAELANAAASARAAGGPALSAATEAARIARIGYAQGRFSQLDLLVAERTLADTNGAFVDALVAYHDAEARLARLTVPAPVIAETPQ